MALTTRRKLLVATVGAGTISYAIACSSPTAGNLPFPPENEGPFDASSPAIEAGPGPVFEMPTRPDAGVDADVDADAALDADASSDAPTDG